MAKIVKVPREVPEELIVSLYDSRALVVGQKRLRHDDVETFFDLRLRDPVFRTPAVREQVAKLYHTALDEHYQTPDGVREYAIIGVSASLAPVVGIIGYVAKCPIIAIVPETRSENQQLRIVGNPVTGCKYAMLDDTIMTGRTISQAVERWVKQGFPIDLILAFCDRQEGGISYIKKKIARLSREVGMKLKVTIRCLTTRKEMLNVLKEMGRITVTDYRRSMQGSTVKI